MFGERIMLPSSYTVGEARHVSRGLGIMLAHILRAGRKTEPVRVVTSDLKAFVGRLSGRSGISPLQQAEGSEMGNLVRRVIRLSFDEANAAGAPPPPTRYLSRALQAAVRRESGGFAGPVTVL